jgi:hypothetical protein
MRCVGMPHHVADRHVDQTVNVNPDVIPCALTWRDVPDERDICTDFARFAKS